MSSDTVATALAPELAAETAGLARTDHLIRRLLRHRSAQIGLVLLAGYVVLIAVGPWLTRHKPIQRQRLTRTSRARCKGSPPSTGWGPTSSAGMN